MSRDDLQRMDDVLDSIAAIRSHVARGEVSDDLVFDAVSARLQIMGEALTNVSGELLGTEQRATRDTLPPDRPDD